MADEPERYNVRVHEDPGHPLWAEVRELPGCFATGTDMEDLRQALTEAISLYLSSPDHEVQVTLEDEPGSATEHHVLARTARPNWSDTSRTHRVAALAARSRSVTCAR